MPYLLVTRKQRLLAVITAIWILSSLAFALKSSYTLNDSIALFLIFGMMPPALTFGIIWIRTAPITPFKTQILNDFHQSTVHATGPLCPKCNGQTELRTSQRKELSGQYFWSCRAYPTCGHITLVNVQPQIAATKGKNDA